MKALVFSFHGPEEKGCSSIRVLPRPLTVKNTFLTKCFDSCIIGLTNLEANRPVRSQFLFKRHLLTVDSARLDWVYVLARVAPEESRF